VRGLQSGASWRRLPEGDNDPDEKFDDFRFGLQCDVRELIARLEAEDATTLAVYRKVLCDFEDMPLEDDDEQERLVNCMEAIIAATEASLWRVSGSLNATGRPLSLASSPRLSDTNANIPLRELPAE
jgi:hypothetical protein